jgi:prophage maintenance system killer protein
MNWIHPFIEGNGRTARAVAYYVFCVRDGALLAAQKKCPNGSKKTGMATKQL